MCGIPEANVRQTHSAGALHKHSVWSIDHNVGNCRVFQQRFERAETEHVMNEFGS